MDHRSNIDVWAKVIQKLNAMLSALLCWCITYIGACEYGIFVCPIVLLQFDCIQYGGQFDFRQWQNVLGGFSSGGFNKIEQTPQKLQNKTTETMVICVYCISTIPA